MDRSAVPAELRRRVLVEAGHRCAIPTCRHIDVDVHHIIPWATCQSHDYDNLIAICPNCHRRAGNDDIDRKSLRMYKFNLRLLHDRFSNVEVDLLFQLNKLAPDEVITWPNLMLILLNRISEAGLIQWKTTEVSGQMMGVDMSPVMLRISNAGREYVGLIENADITE